MVIPLLVLALGSLVFSDFFNAAISSSDLVGTLSGSVAKKAGNNLTFTAYDIVDALNHSSVILHGTIGNLGLLGFGGFDGTTGSGSYAVHIAGTSVGTVNYAGIIICDISSSRARNIWHDVSWSRFNGFRSTSS